MEANNAETLRQLEMRMGKWEARLKRLEDRQSQLEQRLLDESQPGVADAGMPFAVPLDDAPQSPLEMSPPNVPESPLDRTVETRKVICVPDNDDDYRAHWSRARETLAQLGLPPLPEINFEWLAVPDLPRETATVQLKRARADLKAWITENRPHHDVLPEDIRALIEHVYQMIKESYYEKLRDLQIFNEYHSLLNEFNNAPADEASLRVLLNNGLTVLTGWNEIMEEENHWWDPACWYEYRSAVALAQFYDELRARDADDGATSGRLNKSPLDERGAREGSFDKLLKALLKFLKLLGVQKDNALATGALHRNLAKELQNNFSNTIPRNASLINLKVGRILRNRWMKVDAAGAQVVAELVKPAYELVV